MKKYTTAKWIQEKLKLDASHVLYREDGIWYHHLESFPGILFDSKGYLIISSQIEYNNHPSFRLTQALSVKQGISKVKGYIPFNEEQKRALLIESVVDDEVTGEQVTRKLRKAEVLTRNRKIISEIKSMYLNTCQLCGNRLKIRDDIFYSEVHHIKPLGKPHDGPDNKSNMVCVCPSCHVQLDLGAIKIEMNNILTLKHKISDTYLSYHNSYIYNCKIR